MTDQIDSKLELHSLTHPQKRIWHVERLYPNTPIHNLTGTVTYQRSLDFARLEAAFNLLTRVHDATRIQIVEMADNEPRQYVVPWAPFNIPITDFLHESSPHAAFANWLETQSKTPFRLDQGPLFRVAFFRISQEECGYFVNSHHIISDGWSIQTLVSFISQAYCDQFATSSDPQSYLDLLEQEKRYANSSQFGNSRQFWLNELHEAPYYPVDLGGTRGEQRRLQLPREHAGRIRRYASDAGVSLTTLFTALLFVYLWRAECTDDLVIGMPVLNRLGRQKNSIGIFTSTMPLRMHLSKDELMLPMIRRVQSVTARCFRHQRYPYDLLIRDLSANGHSQGQLFRACINVYNTDLSKAARIGDEAVAVDECYVGHQLFPLYVVIKEWSPDDSIEININYKPDQYSRQQIDVLAALLTSRLLEPANSDLTLGVLAGSLPSVGSSLRKLTRTTEMVIGTGASSRTPERPRFPTTRHAPRHNTELRYLRQIPFNIPRSTRVQLEQTFGDGQDVFDCAATTALCVLLARCCSLDEVSIGIIGPGEFQVGLLDVSCKVEPEATFRQLLTRMRSALSPLSPRMTIPTRAEGVLVDLRHSGESSDIPAVSFAVRPPDGDGPGSIVFDTRLYDLNEINWIVSRILHILELAASSSNTRIGEIEVVSLAEQKLLLHEFNDTATDFPDSITIIRLFEDSAARYSDLVALRSQTDTWTYSRLNQRANDFAHVLRDRGIERGSIVPIMMERSPELLVGILGILKAGGAYLPIDPSYPRSRIEFILEDCQASLVVSKPEFIVSTSGCLLVEVSDDDACSRFDPNPSLASGPSDLAYVCYTSGSTGRPKGVMIEHRSLVNRLHWMQRVYPLNETDVLLQKTSISFDVSVWELFWWALAGASLCLSAQGDEKNPERLVECIAVNKVTVIHFVPSMLQAFLSYVEHDGDATRLQSLRRVFASGEALRPDHVDSFNRLLAGAGTRLTNLYGPTEATVDVTYYDCPLADQCDHVPIGEPIDNIWLRILSPTLRLQPVGAPGELYIGGVGVARGYLNRSDLTDQRFLMDPYMPDQRLYRTGDLARWSPNGQVEFLGRNDDQIKLRGYRIELGEIEAALREHVSVEDAAVTVRKSPRGSQQLCGYVVLRAPCAMNQIREHLLARLPDYMVPTWLKQIAAIPLGPAGKANRAALPEPTADDSFQRPLSLDECVLAEIWRDVLEIPYIGADDNFFALGGDSIKIISLISKARSRALRITTEDVYRYPTIGGLVQALKTNDISQITEDNVPFELLQVEDRPRLPDSAEDAYPLSALQLGLIYQSKIIRSTPFYHDVFSYRIKGIFDGSKFTDAVQQLYRNHDIFRTTFHLTGFSEPIQIVHRQVTAPLNIADLREMTPDAQECAIQRDIAAIREKALKGEASNLIGFHIHVLRESEYIYTIDFHDSALDGWSVNLIHRELFECYYSLLSGKTHYDRKLKTKFRDFLELERKAVSDPNDKAFWAETLNGSSFLRLPRWPGRELAAMSGVDFHEVPLPPGLSDVVRQTANRLGLPVKSVLLAAHVYILSLLTGERDVVTGYEYGVRPEITDSESVIGLFLNTLPLRIEVTSHSWEELIRKVHQAEINFIPHRRYPMAQMKRDRRVRGPLFEMVFNFTHFHVLSGLKRLAGFDLTEVKVRAETEFVFRFECSIHPFTNDLLIWIHYHADVFPREQIETIGGYYTKALEALTRDPSAPPNAQSMLGDEERHRQVYDFNANSREYPSDRCFHHLFEEQVKLAPTRLAATCGSERWTFDQLNRAANQLAHAILHRTAGSKSVVAVAMRRNLAWMASVIACFKAGCAYLPLDLDHPANRIAEILSQSGCELIIVSDKKTGMNLSSGPEDRRGRSAVTFVVAEEIFNAEANIHNPSVSVTGDDLAYIIFTSGSTGLPKGAMIQHDGMLNHLLAKVNDLTISSDDVVAQNASHCFDISLWQLLAASLVGGQITIIEKDTVTDIRKLVSTVRDERVSILEVVPSYLAMVLDWLEVTSVPLAMLKYLLVTGEQVSVRLLDRWFVACPGIAVVNAYGPTEAADDICHHIMYEAPMSALVPVGRPVQNLNVYVLNERNELLPLGAAGEVCVSGVGVGRGYINDPRRTSDVFVSDPFRPSLRMYKTGDIGRWFPDGVLEIAGRKDDQVKIRGYRIEMGEIESHLQQCPGVSQAAVVADVLNATLTAFVVTTHETMDSGLLKRELSLQLPEYMVPSRFVRVARLPLSEHGKVAKQTLIEWLGQLEEEVVPIPLPVGATEIELSKLWADVLKVEQTRIGRSGNFFDLGGDSLKAMELSLRGCERFSINDVFKYPHLRDLVERIERLAVTDGAREILVDYETSDSATLSIIGFTYAAGNAANFKPLFDVLRARRRDLACYAIEIPRGPNAPPDVENLAQLCLDQIRATIDTPIILWGHCSGSALALEVGRLLEANSLGPRLIVLGGKVINSRPMSKLRSLVALALSPFMAVDAAGMSYRQIRDWLVRKTGFDGFMGLSEADSQLITDRFRQDAVCAARFFERANSVKSNVAIKAPILNVVAKDDLLTRHYRKKHRNWRLFSHHVELSILDGGGHYFIKTWPNETADVILRAICDLETYSNGPDSPVDILSPRS